MAYKEILQTLMDNPKGKLGKHKGTEGVSDKMWLDYPSIASQFFVL